MNRHEWHDRTDDDEVRYVRATLHGGRWTLSARLKCEPEWTELAPPALDDLLDLRDQLWAKYQRGRVPHEQVTGVDRLIEEARAR